MHVELLTFSPTVPGVATQSPLRGNVRRHLHAVNRDEYWLVELERPLVIAALGTQAFRYLLLWPEPGKSLDLAEEMICNTGVDAVLDESLLGADFLEFGKCHPIGVGRMRVTAGMRARISA